MLGDLREISEIFYLCQYIVPPYGEFWFPGDSTRENLKRVKAIIRFEAEHPNDMWQTDIMGKITFAHLGDLYLIATLDDHSRFVPYGKWFKTQGKMNVFSV